MVFFQFSPISRLPADVFVDIVSLVIEYQYDYCQKLTPLSTPPRLNMLISCLLVSRSWYSTIKNATGLWTTLRIDGALNLRNAEKKVLWWSEKSLGRSLEDRVGSDLDGKGIRNLVISAAGSLNLGKLLSTLRDTGAADALESITVSFVDEGGSNKDIPTDYRGVSLEGFILDTCRNTLKSLVWCSEFGIAGYHNLPDSALFPKLEKLWVYGLSSTSPDYSPLPYYIFPFLSPSGGAIRNDLPSPIVDLRVCDVTLLNGKTNTFDAPNLKYIDLGVDRSGETLMFAITLDSPWLTSSITQPGIKRLHLSGGFLLDDTVRTKDPDLATNWKELESLEISKIQHVATYLLDLAIKQTLSFPYLTNLNLRAASISSVYLELFNNLNAPSLINISLESTSPKPRITILALPTFSSTLKSLDLSNALWITDEMVSTLPIIAPNLLKLNLSGLENLTGRPIMQFVQFRSLSVVSNDEAVRKESRSESKSNKKHYSVLEELKLQGCKRVDTTAVAWLRDHVTPKALRYTFLHINEKPSKGRRYVL